MGLSFWHILIVFLVVLLFFGVGRIQEVLSELGKGVKAFKEGMGEGPTPVAPARKAPAQPAKPKAQATVAKAAAKKAKAKPAPKKAAAPQKGAKKAPVQKR